MLILAIVFGRLAALGSLVGLGVVGGPIGSHALNSYGWVLFVNAAALTAFSIASKPRRPPSSAIGRRATILRARSWPP